MRRVQVYYRTMKVRDSQWIEYVAIDTHDDVSFHGPCGDGRLWYSVTRRGSLSGPTLYSARSVVKIEEEIAS